MAQIAAQLGWLGCLCRYWGRITTSILGRLRRFHPCRDAQKVSASPSAACWAFSNQQMISWISEIWAEPMPLWQEFRCGKGSFQVSRTYAIVSLVTRVLLMFAKPMPLWQGFCSSLSCMTLLWSGRIRESKRSETDTVSFLIHGNFMQGKEGGGGRAPSRYIAVYNESPCMQRRLRYNIINLYTRWISHRIFLHMRVSATVFSARYGILQVAAVQGIHFLIFFFA